MPLASPARNVRCRRSSVGERAEQELAEPARRVEVVGALEAPARFGQRGQRQPVPGRDRLVVTERLRSLLADLEQPCPLVRAQLAADHRSPVLEGLEQLLAHAFVGRPREGQPLDAVRVRVLGRGEAALGQEQLAEHVVERLLGHAAVALVAGHDPAVEIRRGQQRVVVEHLLEVRDEPFAVDRVPVEAAADEVVHAAGGHRVEGLRDHRQGLLVAAQVHAQKELERRGGRELRRAAPAAPLAVELPLERAGRLAEHALGERIGRGLELGRLANGVDDRRGLA